MAEQSKDAAQLRRDAQELSVEQRITPIVCAVYRKEFLAIYTRTPADNLFRLAKIEKIDTTSNDGAAVERFPESDFEDVPIICPWCETSGLCRHVYSDGSGCGASFCQGAGTPSTVKGASFHTCPQCGIRNEYRHWDYRFDICGTSKRESAIQRHLENGNRPQAQGIAAPAQSTMRKLLDQWNA